MKITRFDNTEPYLAPDLIYDPAGGVADFALSGIENVVNPGGLESRNALTTAVIMCLFTDRRVLPEELRTGDSNRGWPGDSFDVRDTDAILGSKLWLLRRRALTDETVLLAEDYADEALQPLLTQQVFARFDIEAKAVKAKNRLDLSIVGYGRDGIASFDQRFQILWDQIA